MIRDSGDLGIWHETYLVPAHSYETMCDNMPRFGLAVAGSHVPLGAGSTAAHRSGARTEDIAPVEGY